MTVFSIFNLNPIIAIVKATKDLMNAKEVKACRNRVQTASIKERQYFILRSYLATIFLSLINAHVVH